MLFIWTTMVSSWTVTTQVSKSSFTELGLARSVGLHKPAPPPLPLPADCVSWQEMGLVDRVRIRPAAKVNFDFVAKKPAPSKERTPTLPVRAAFPDLSGESFDQIMQTPKKQAARHDAAHLLPVRDK